MAERTTSAIVGHVIKAELIERRGTFEAGESERVAELLLTYDDGRSVRLRAESCSCCGVDWNTEDAKAAGVEVVLDM